MSTPQDNLDPFADISDLFANPGDDREANRAYARAQAQQRGLDPDFVDRLFRQESGYNGRAVSPKGARGVGQMMPETGRRYGLKNPFDPQENIDKSLDYISDLHKRFNGNLRLIAAGYHSGEGAAEKALRNPKGNPKTAAYVRNVAGEASGNSADPFADISDLLETGSPAPQSPQVKPTAPDANALAGLEDLLSGAQDTPAAAIQAPSQQPRTVLDEVIEYARLPEKPTEFQRAFRERRARPQQDAQPTQFQAAFRERRAQKSATETPDETVKFLRSLGPTSRQPRKPVDETPISVLTGKPVTPGLLAQQSGIMRGKVKPGEAPHEAFDRAIIPGPLSDIPKSIIQGAVNAGLDIPSYLADVAGETPAKGAVLGLIDDIRTSVKDALPIAKPESLLTSELPSAAGSSLPTIAASMLAPEAIAFRVVAGLGAAQNGHQIYQEARAAGKSHEESLRASIPAALAGTTERFGLGSLGAKVGKQTVGKLLKDELLEEGGQEGLVTFLNNGIALGYFDPTRELDRDVLKNALMGAIVGPVVGGGAHLASKAAERLAIKPPTEEQEPIRTDLREPAEAKETRAGRESQTTDSLVEPQTPTARGIMSEPQAAALDDLINRPAARPTEEQVALLGVQPKERGAAVTPTPESAVVSPATVEAQTEAVEKPPKTAEAQAAPHEFSSTQVNLPESEATRRIQRVAKAIPDRVLAEDGREEQPHITVKYGLHADDAVAVKKVLADEGPITVTLGKTSIFPAKEGADYDVVKVDVDSPDLHRLNKKIADALPNTDTFPDYKPHVTIAYVKPGEGKKYAGKSPVEGQTIKLDSIAFSDKAGNVTEIPLKGVTSAKQPEVQAKTEAVLTEKPPHELTRAEFRRQENQPRFDAIVSAIEAGKPIQTRTQQRITPLTKPEHVRLAKNGEIQTRERTGWVTLTDDQAISLAAQAGIKPPTFDERVYHHAVVEDAIKAGKTVPANVLADYPELAQQAKRAEVKRTVAQQKAARVETKAAKVAEVKKAAAERGTIPPMSAEQKEALGLVGPSYGKWWRPLQDLDGDRLAPSAVQADARQAYKALRSGDVESLRSIAAKYTKEASRDMAGGAGPGRVKQARHGVVQLQRVAELAADKLETLRLVARTPANAPTIEAKAATLEVKAPTKPVVAAPAPQVPAKPLAPHDAFTAAIQKRAPGKLFQKKDTPLLTAIRRAGGIDPDHQEGKDIARYFSRREGGHGLMIKGGKKVDQLVRALREEEGFPFTQDDDPQHNPVGELLAAMQQEAEGSPFRSYEDESIDFEREADLFLAEEQGFNNVEDFRIITKISSNKWFDLHAKVTNENTAPTSKELSQFKKLSRSLGVSEGGIESVIKSGEAGRSESATEFDFAAEGDALARERAKAEKIRQEFLTDYDKIPLAPDVKHPLLDLARQFFRDKRSDYDALAQQYQDLLGDDFILIANHLPTIFAHAEKIEKAVEKKAEAAKVIATDMTAQGELEGGPLTASELQWIADRRKRDADFAESQKIALETGISPASSGRTVTRTATALRKGTGKAQAAGREPGSADQAATQAVTPTDRQSFKKAMIDRWGYDEEVAHRTSEVMEAFAESYAFDVKQSDPKADSAKAKEAFYRAVQVASGPLGEGGLMQGAWHGSPFHFDKFTLEHIGEGEGAQAYGWGLYFAGKREVAEYYRSGIANDQPSTRIHVDGKPLIEVIPNNITASDVGRLLERNGLDIAKARSDEFDSGRRSAVLAALVKLEDGKLTTKRPGATYRVDLKPAEDEYLLWDRPLSEQSEKVQQALSEGGFGVDTSRFSDAQLFARARKYFEGKRSVSDWDEDLGMRMTVRAGYKAFKEGPAEFRKWVDQQHASSWVINRMIGPAATAELGNASDFYRTLGRSAQAYKYAEQHGLRLGSPESASKYLNSLGIRGIKYKDEGSRNYRILSPDESVSGKWVVGEPTDDRKNQRFFDSETEARAYFDSKQSHNYVIFNDADIAIEKVLFQEAHAATEFTKTGEAIIRAGQNPNESSGLHEMVHATLPVISRLAAQPNTPATLKTAVTAILEHSGFASVEEYVGLHEKWTANTANKAERDKYRDGSEKAARGFEGYAREGKAPTASLKAAFEKFKEWLSRIYQRIRPDMEITDDVRRAWDRLLGSEREAAASKIKEEDHWNFRRSTFASPETEARFRMLVRDAVVTTGTEHKTRVSRAEHLERVEELSPDLLPEVKRMRESQIATREIFLAAVQYSQTLVNQAMDLRTRITPSTLPDEALRLGDRIAALEHDATEIMAHTVGVRSEFGRNLALLATQKTDQLSPEKVLAFGKKLADQRGLESNSQRWRTAARKLVGLSTEIESAQKEKKRIARERKKVEAGEGKPKKREPWRAVMLGHLKAQATEASARLQEQFGKKLYQLSNDELDRVRAKFDALKQQAAGRPIATVVSDYLQQQGLFGQELNAGQQEALREMATPTRRAALKTEQGGLFEGGIKPTLESRAEQKGENLLFGGGDEFKLFQRDRQIDTPEFKRWFGESKAVDEKGEPLRLYHGSSRLDRVGPRFLKKRATSGPMPFFTDDPEIASGYTKKRDTSLPDDAGYHEWFRVKVAGARSPVSIDRAWHWLTPAEKEQIAELAPRVRNTDDEGNESEINLGPKDHASGLGGYVWHVQQARGNHYQALIDEWLSSGSLYGEEEAFFRVLKLAGVDTGKVEYHDPSAERGGILPVYLALQNPLETGAIPQSVVDALERQSRRQREPRSTIGADMWDKSTTSPRDWITELKTDLASGKNSFAWTRIPDWVTDVLRAQGYDGIHDTGGKMGGEGHDVWVPFEPTQIKSAIGNRGTFDPNDKNILHQDAELPTAAHDIATILAARVAEESQTKKGLPLDRILDEMRQQFPDVINQYEQQIKATADSLLKEARRQALTEASRDPEQRASARAELARDVADARRTARLAEKAAEQKQRQIDSTWEADAEKASKEATAAWDKANAEWQKSQEAVAAQFSQAERDAQKVFERQQRESVADEARRISRAAKQAEQQRLEEIADDAREQLKRTREAAAEAIKSGVAPEARARRKAEREAPQKARRWQSPIHEAAEAARSRMSTAGYQPTLQDLIAIGAEKSIDPTMTASQWHREMNQYGDLYTRNMRKVRDGAAEMRVDARKGAADRRIEERAAGRAEGLTRPPEQQQARQDYQKWAEGELARLKAEEDWQNRRIRTAKRDMAREFAALQKPAMLDTVLDALSLPMSLVSSVDLPALRQGIVPLMNHPKAWFEGLLTGASTWTEVQMEQKTDALQNHPLAELMELSGLKQSAVEQRRSPLSRLAREEQFQNRFARMFPHVRVSERQYTITMDEMRARIFTDLATPMLQDYSPALHPEHYAELARVVNIMTGIGEIGGITRYTPAINRLLFSTRLMVSRFQFLFMPVSPHFWRDMPPPIRKIAAKEWVGFWGKSAALFGTLAALGLTSLDPDDDEFLKLKIPGTNQKWELLGNFSSYLKFVAKMSRSAYRIGTGQKEFKGDRAQDTLTQFARSKLAPAPGTAVSWMTGRTFIGQPFEAKQAAIDSIFPMFARDVYEAVKLDGARGLVMAPFGILGGGVSAFRTRKMPDRTQSEAERIATGALRETMSSTPETIEEYKRRTLITELTAATKAGKPTDRITRDIEKVGGPLSEKERQRVEKRVKATPLQHAYPHLRPEQQDEVLKVATEAERMSVEPHYKSIQQSSADRVKALREDPEFQKRTPSDQRQIVKDTISDARRDQRKLEGRAGGASDEETALSVAKSVAQDRLRLILESRPEFEQLDRDQKSEAMRRLGSLFRRFNVDKDVPARARGLRAERERMALERMIQSGAMERLVNRIPLGR